MQAAAIWNVGLPQPAAFGKLANLHQPPIQYDTLKLCQSGPCDASPTMHSVVIRRRLIHRTPSSVYSYQLSRSLPFSCALRPHLAACKSPIISRHVLVSADIHQLVLRPRVLEYLRAVRRGSRVPCVQCVEYHVNN